MYICTNINKKLVCGRTKNGYVNIVQYIHSLTPHSTLANSCINIPLIRKAFYKYKYALSLCYYFKSQLKKIYIVNFNNFSFN